MTTKEKHVHKFKKHKYSTGKFTFFCTLPDCNVKIAPALALGKKCVCWICGEEFILTEYALRLVKPHCINCHKPRNPVVPTHESPRETLKEEIRETINPLAERLKKVLNHKTIDMAEEEEI